MIRTLLRRKPMLAFAGGLLALAGLAATVPAPSTASAAPGDPVNIRFHQLICDEETDGWGDDEAYAVFFIADLSGPLPTGRTVRTEVFNNLNSGESRTRVVPQLWGGLAGAPIRDPDQVIILGAVMENDGSDAGEVVAMVQPMMLGALIGAIAPGRPRADVVSDLRVAMNDALDAAAGASSPLSPDDRLGGAAEFRLTRALLDRAAAGTPVVLEQRYRDNGEDATYRIRIRITGR